MSPAAIFSLILSKAEVFGPMVVSMVKTIIDGVKADHPELDERKLEKTSGLLDAAVDKAPK